MRAFSFSFVLSFLACATSYAYVPPAEFILKTIATRHGDQKLVRLKSQVTAMKGAQAVGARFRETTLVNFATKTVMSRAYDDAGRELYATEARFSELSPAGAVLFDSSPEGLKGALSRAGINIQVSDPAKPEATGGILKRWKTTFAWVIGAEDSPNQLWIEKDSFLPLRLLLAEPKTQEIRFESYRFAEKFSYPRAMGVLTTPGDEQSQAIRAETNEMSVNVDAKEFRGFHPGMTEAGNSAGGDVRDLILSYYRSFR